MTKCFFPENNVLRRDERLFFFDFGTSNESNGKKINSGLLYWKEGYGARTHTQDFYEILTSNFNKLNDLFINPK